MYGCGLFCVAFVGAWWRGMCFGVLKLVDNWWGGFGGGAAWLGLVVALRVGFW